MMYASKCFNTLLEAVKAFRKFKMVTDPEYRRRYQEEAECKIYTAKQYLSSVNDKMEKDFCEQKLMELHAEYMNFCYELVAKNN